MIADIVRLVAGDRAAVTALIGEGIDWEFPVSALDVVAMGTYRRVGWCRPGGRRFRDAALPALDRVGMADFARRQISQLSGGQQQRVFPARALFQDASLYLMDEPFAGVDAATEQAIVALLQDLRRAGRTVVAVRHALETVHAYFDQALLLNMPVVATGCSASGGTGWVWRMRIAREDALGVLYRLEELRGGGPEASDAALVRGAIGAGPLCWHPVAYRLRRQRLVEGRGGALRLTEEGRAEGRRLVRTHRLWESFLHRNLALAADHVHATAERLEHVTDAGMACRLAGQAGGTAQDPQSRPIP